MAIARLWRETGLCSALPQYVGQQCGAPARGAPSHLEKLNRLAMAGRSLVTIACPVIEGGQSGVAFYRSAHCAGLAGSCNGAECPLMSGDTMCVRIRGASM